MRVDDQVIPRLRLALVATLPMAWASTMITRQAPSTLALTVLSLLRFDRLRPLQSV